MLNPDLREDQTNLEQSLVGHGRELEARMNQAREYHRTLLHALVWAEPRIAQALNPEASAPWPGDDSDLVAMLRLAPFIREPPADLGWLDSPFDDPPPLNPFARPCVSSNDTFYTSPGGGLRLTLGELNGLGDVWFDDEWIEILYASSPAEEAYEFGMGLGGPQGHSLMDFFNWLEQRLRRYSPDYVAACLDMYFGGLGSRIGALPRAVPVPGNQS